MASTDQDNALIHEGRSTDDAWFGDLAERFNRLLDEAGVPYCRGAIMARNPSYRHSLAGWQAQIVEEREPSLDELFFAHVGIRAASEPDA